MILKETVMMRIQMRKRMMVNIRLILRIQRVRILMKKFPIEERMMEAMVLMKIQMTSLRKRMMVNIRLIMRIQRTRILMKKLLIEERMMKVERDVAMDVE